MATERTPRQAEERQGFDNGTRIVSREQRRLAEREREREEGGKIGP